jgi:intein/homing endonuclease
LILNEAKIKELQSKTRNQTPKLAGRSNYVNTDYIGISKFGIFNFRTTSQTSPGNYWYQTLEIVDFESKIMDEDITADFIKDLIENNDIRIMCDCLTGDSNILMEDGTCKYIKDIEEGDRVVTHLGNVKTVRGKSKRPADNDLLEIDLGDRKIKCTKNHQFLVNDGKNNTWVYAKDLTTDMELLELGDV